MKWFKYLTGSLGDEYIWKLMYKFGSDGYLVFFGVHDIMADQFDIHNPGKLTIEIKQLQEKLRLSRQKVVKVLTFSDKISNEIPEKNKGIYATFENDVVHLYSPRLKDLADNFTQKQLQKLRSQNEVTTKSLPPIEVEVDKEEDKDKKDVKKKASPKKNKHLDFVLLTEYEVKKLYADYDMVVGDYIQRLNDYIGSTGKRYRSHYHTLKNWMRKDNILPDPEKSQFQQPEKEQSND